MEDFKIIFYIAVAIAWAVYKNYQKVQKNRPVTHLPPPTPEIIIPKNNPVEMITKKPQKKNNSYSKKQEECKNDFKSAKVEQKQKTILTSEKNLEALYTLKSEAIHKEAEEEKQIKNNAISEFEESELFNLKKMDIRTAIIYSEILRRPYV